MADEDAKPHEIVDAEWLVRTLELVRGFPEGCARALAQADSLQAVIDVAWETGEYGGGRAAAERRLALTRRCLDSAHPYVAHSLDELRALRRNINLWILLAVAAAVVLGVLLVSWFASRISRPLTELADKTSRIDLDRLDIDFSTRRKDEIGDLSRLLSDMTGRLRASTILVKDAERRATLGELARQVNHDIRLDCV